MSQSSVLISRDVLDTSSIVPILARRKVVYSDPDELRKKVDAFMLAFDAKEAELRKKQKEKEVDVDGFELVKPAAPLTTAFVDTSANRKKRKSSSEGLSDFYKFQIKERKLAEWGDIKKQEFSDKDRLEEMKSQNRFQL
jgi:ribosomal RNA-processing protein 7